MFEIFLTPRRQGRPWRRHDTMALSAGAHVLLLLGAAHVPIHTELAELRSPQLDETVTFLRVLDRQEHTAPAPVRDPTVTATPGLRAADAGDRRARPRPQASEPGSSVARTLRGLAAGLPDLVPGERIASSLPPVDLEATIGLTAGFLPGGGAAGAPGRSAGEPADLSVVAELPVLRNAQEMQRVWRRLYPDALNRRGIEGEATVSFVVGTNGRVDPGTIRLVHASHPALGEATLVGVARLRYRPARLDGRSVPVRVTLPVRWTLKDPG